MYNLQIIVSLVELSQPHLPTYNYVNTLYFVSRIARIAHDSNISNDVMQDILL
jgi:hypothetical protein